MTILPRIESSDSSTTTPGKPGYIRACELAGAIHLNCLLWIVRSCPQDDHELSTPSNGPNSHKTSSVPGFVGSQRRPITKGWFWVNCTKTQNRRSD